VVIGAFPVIFAGEQQSDFSPGATGNPFATADELVWRDGFAQMYDVIAYHFSVGEPGAIPCA
jgi:hypothetical protein